MSNMMKRKCKYTLTIIQNDSTRNGLRPLIIGVMSSCLYAVDAIVRRNFAIGDWLANCWGSRDIGYDVKPALSVVVAEFKCLRQPKLWRPWWGNIDYSYSTQ